MTDQEIAQQLKEIERLATELQGHLNSRKADCQCCGFTKYDDWHQGQLHTQLGGIATKIHRFVRVFEDSKRGTHPNPQEHLQPKR